MSKRSADFDYLPQTPKRQSRKPDAYPTPQKDIGLAAFPNTIPPPVFTTESSNPTVQEPTSVNQQRSTPLLAPMRKGKDITIPDITAHEKWIGSIGETAWQPLTPFVKQLTDSNNQPVTFLLFGVICSSTCGIYGDHVAQYSDSLTKANMKWTLRASNEHSNLFLRQLDVINTITNTIDKDFKLNGSIVQRPVKNAAEVEIRCKLVKKRKPRSTIVLPEDDENKRLWAKCSKDGYEPNTLPLGLWDFDGELQPFLGYENTLVPGTSVVVTARMQAAFFQNQPYVQVIPLKVQVFGTGESEEENYADIF
ncbi:hypothetical protein HDV02_004084 [Globomyces sp. JEL0801]|nr:hypothetical protein HDV02_004084 [Globomyces sp. JEL0801]